VDDDIRMLELAWLKHLPYAEPPSLQRAQTWLRSADVATIISEFERVSRRPHILNPQGWVSATLQRGANHFAPRKERQ